MTCSLIWIIQLRIMKFHGFINDKNCFFKLKYGKKTRIHSSEHAALCFDSCKNSVFRIGDTMWEIAYA